MNRRVVFCTTCLAVALCGCGPHYDLEGSWIPKDQSKNHQVLTFKRGNTYEAKVNRKGTVTDYTGTYRLEGDQLTLIQGQEILKDGTVIDLSSQPQLPPYTLKWLNSNEMEMVYVSNVTDFIRVTSPAQLQGV